jgi:FtsH-binding integral membrane protein
MSVDSSFAAANLPPPASRAGARRATRFYRIAALIALLAVLVGFGPSFYLKFLFHKPPPLTALLVVHGVVMTSWFVLFLVQAQLAASRNLRLHRRLGVAGVVLAAAVLVLGTTVAITGARLGHTPGPPPLVFLAIPLTDMAVFAVLAGGALLLRRDTETHKRLMLLAFIGLLTAAVARMPWADGNIIVPFSATVLFAGACVALDTWRHRRLHPAFGWGFALFALSWPLRLWLSGTEAWLSAARWLTS